MLPVDVLYIIAALAMLAIIIAPLGCWIILWHIRRMLDERLPEGNRIEFHMAKQTQALTELAERRKAVSRSA